MHQNRIRKDDRRCDHASMLRVDAIRPMANVIANVTPSSGYPMTLCAHARYHPLALTTAITRYGVSNYFARVGTHWRRS